MDENGELENKNQLRISVTQTTLLRIKIGVAVGAFYFCVLNKGALFLSSFVFLTGISFYVDPIFFLTYGGNRPIIGTHFTRRTLQENFFE